MDATITSGLVSLQTAVDLINRGHCLVIAGDEWLLTQLPPGQWIAGSIPYFMGNEGGVMTKDKLFVHDFSVWADGCTIKSYMVEQLDRVTNDAAEHGFSIIIMPGGSEVLSSYARNAPNYDDIFSKPIVGWVSGSHLQDVDRVSPIVIDGKYREARNNQAVVMHFSLPHNKIALLDIVNLFEQGEGAEIRFPVSGFSAGECLIDGKRQHFSDFLSKNKIDTRLPLVADYCGAMVNVSIKSVDDTMGNVHFYAPVFNDIAYRMALPVNDYVGAFEDGISTSNERWVFSCNCILNYLFMELEGKQTGNITGPITFGEIAYQLLNQTLVYLSIEDY